jgi:hypothetical protein
MGIEEPMLAQQYEDGQLVGARGVWHDEDPHMTYREFEERARCHFHSLRRPMCAVEINRRKDMFAKLCKDFPQYWERYYKTHIKK